MVSIIYVEAWDANATVVLHRLDAFLGDLTSVRLQTNFQLHRVGTALRVLACDTISCNIRTTAVTHLFELLDNSFAALELGEVHNLHRRVPLLDEGKTAVLVSHDDATCLVHRHNSSTYLSNGVCTPYSNDVFLVNVNSRIHNTVPACAEYVRKVQALLVVDTIGKHQ
jgi:hypothetical protein